jgi:1,4-dihydroxy-2-naphthoyl-CoA hydrolase
VAMSMPVDARHHQPLGYLHGGASVVLAESVATVGAWLNCLPGKVAFDLEINARTHLINTRPAVDGLLSKEYRPSKKSQKRRSRRLPERSVQPCSYLWDSF